MNPSYATASLYVGDLEPNVTESMLFETFKKVGTVSSIRVCRDAATRRSLGYAYINFHNVADAERAIDTLNYTFIGGGAKPCRIMWSHRDPALRRSGKGNIFIKNLDKSIDHKALCDTFSAFGNILSCKVAVDKSTGESKGFGFVHYENPEAAQSAIEQVNGMLLCGKQVFVGPFQPRKARGGPDGEVKFTNCYVKNLATDIDEEALRKLFEEFGAVNSAVIMRTAESKESRGFGFVNFEEFDAAKSAVEALNGKEVNGKQLYVARAQKKGERESQLKSAFEQRKQKYAESNVYVKNLDESIDGEKLSEVFGKFGEMVSCKVMTDEKSSSLGFGFVCFSTPEEAHKAINEMNGHMLLGKPLYVALAQRKEVRAAQLQAQYAHRLAGRGIALPNAGYPQQHMMQAQIPGAFPLVNQARPPFVGPGYAAMVRPPRWAGAGRGGAGGPPNPNYAPPARGGIPAAYVLNQNTGNPLDAAAAAGVANTNLPAAQGGVNNNAVPQTGGAAQANVGGPAPGGVAAASPQHPSLADLSEKDRKQVLGEFLYPKIEALLKASGDKTEETGKITGMLLESLDHGELVHLLESPAELKSRVEEAINVLREHLGKDK